MDLRDGEWGERPHLVAVPGRARLLLLILLMGSGACATRRAADAVGLDEHGDPIVCVDADGDGYGHNCVMGSDCDDGDPAVTYECRDCARPERGCPCNPAQAPERCFEMSQESEEGLLCFEGTRYCRSVLVKSGFTTLKELLQQ